jgi:hypothetical protein
MVSIIAKDYDVVSLRIYVLGIVSGDLGCLKGGRQKLTSKRFC